MVVFDGCFACYAPGTNGAFRRVALFSPARQGHWNALFFLNAVSYLAVIFALFTMRDVNHHSTGGRQSTLGKPMRQILAVH